MIPPSQVTYVVVTPVRNEAGRIERTIESMRSQTVRPALWVVVDDGSTDETSLVLQQASSVSPWIKVVSRVDRGFRSQGTGVIDAFYEGFKLIEGVPWEFLSKLDGDLEFPADYFERCFERFSSEPKLGIGGGAIFAQDAGRLILDAPGDPAFHVRGATKIYRRECWDQIGGLLRAPGWDTLDELKSIMLGWVTRPFTDLQVLQLKATGSADGTWKNWVKNGTANYITGYHPLFMAAKCAKRLLQKPFLIGAAGLWWGYCRAFLRRTRRVDDSALIQFIRRQQINKLLMRPSLW